MQSLLLAYLFTKKLTKRNGNCFSEIFNFDGRHFILFIYFEEVEKGVWVVYEVSHLPGRPAVRSMRWSFINKTSVKVRFSVPYS